MNSGFYAVQNPAICRVLYLTGCPGRSRLYFIQRLAHLVLAIDQSGHCINLLAPVPPEISHPWYLTWQRIKASAPCPDTSRRITPCGLIRPTPVVQPGCLLQERIHSQSDAPSRLKPLLHGNLCETRVGANSFAIRHPIAAEAAPTTLLSPRFFPSLLNSD